MYCPNCGQQQISDEMRFCSRCGLALSGLAEWLAEGRLPAIRAEEARASESARRKGMRRAKKLMFFSGVLLPVCLVLSLISNHGEPMVIPCVLFFVSIVWLLYARLFSDKTASLNIQAPQTSTLGSNSTRSSLPPATNISNMPGVGRQRVRTNELAGPPSVTEHTTRLLDNE